MEALMAGEIEKFDAKERAKKRKRGEGFERRVRGASDYQGERAEHTIDLSGVSKGRRQRMPEWQRALRAGDPARALEIALATNDGAQTAALLAALTHQSALRTAIRARGDADPRALVPLVAWLRGALRNPRTLRAAADAAAVVIDEHGAALGAGGRDGGGGGAQLEEAVEALHEAVRKGAEVAQMATSTAGMLDLLGAGA
jgi:hypothetical protein